MADNDTPQAQNPNPRGVFIHSDGNTIQGMQLSGNITKLEAYALLSVTLERMRADLKL